MRWLRQVRRQRLRRLCQRVCAPIAAVVATAGCGDCAPKTTTVCKKVWVPNCVTKEVPVTVCKQVVEDQPYEYNVTVCKPETRTCQVRVCNFETQTKTRTVTVCEYETETRTRTYQTCKMVPEQMTKEVQYTVCVPKTETPDPDRHRVQHGSYEKEVTYTVCVPHQSRRKSK